MSIKEQNSLLKINYRIEQAEIEKGDQCQPQQASDSRGEKNLPNRKNSDIIYLQRPHKPYFEEEIGQLLYMYRRLMMLCFDEWRFQSKNPLNLTGEERLAINAI